ncbi:MAG: stage V sporulation protein T [Ruminococcaceae bacterium]|nr:stage V sporulation protein T [Oscillospiraceae bacterium]
MKATGIVRRIDDLGRVVIPKEIRRTMRIREGDPLEIYTDRDGEVIFKKYSPIGSLSDFASQYAETLTKTCGFPVAITDKDSIIAVSGASRKELMEQRVSPDMEKLMEDKMHFVSEESGKPLYVTEASGKYMAGVVSPIIAEGDIIGNVVIMKDDESRKITEVETKLAQTASMFLGKQMEI